MFAQFILDNFPDTFERSSNPQGKLFLQDGDPSQNSRKAKNAIDVIGARKFDIPPGSPDMNPIENVFNNVKMELHKQALEQNILLLSIYSCLFLYNNVSTGKNKKI